MPFLRQMTVSSKRLEKQKNAYLYIFEPDKLSVSVTNLIILPTSLTHPGLFVFPPCPFPVAISVFNLTQAGGMKVFTFPLQDRVGYARRQEEERGARNLLGTDRGVSQEGTGETCPVGDF